MIISRDYNGSRPFRKNAGGISLLLIENEQTTGHNSTLDVPASQLRREIPPDNKSGTANFQDICSI